MEAEYSIYYEMVEKIGEEMIKNNPDKFKEIVGLISEFSKKLGEFEAKHNIK